MLLSAPSLVTLVFALFAHSSVARLVEGPSGIEYSKRVGDVTPSSSPEPTYCLAFECPDSLRYSAPDVRLGTTEENDNIVCTYSVSVPFPLSLSPSTKLTCSPLPFSLSQTRR